jgi:hypothetical protein
MTSDRALLHPRYVGASFGLWAVWTAATFLLEGYPRTLLRPDAVGLRIAYALIANILIGVVGAAVVLRHILRGSGVNAQRPGFQSRGRTMSSIVLGTGLGLVLFLIQQPASTDPIVIGNAFAQVWVVSMAEVLVCWVVVGNAIALAGVTRDRVTSTGVALVVAAAAFGVYHIGHSPPFNTLQMIAFLSIVGLATGAYYFIVGEIYGTIVFHNFLALKGVTAALADQGRLDQYAAIQPALVVTAAVATAILISVAVHLRKQPPVASPVSA